MTLRISLLDEHVEEINHIISKNLDRILLNSRLIGTKIVNDWKIHVSYEALQLISTDDNPVSTDDNLISFSHMRISDKIVHILQKSFPENTIQVSGHFHYPNTGYMSWHTNADVPCQRLYITWAKEAGKSFFRYYQDGKVITDYDDAGLTFRLFNITDKPPYLWHCVGSETDRLSFGFRIL
jgi:hypothetical protein